MLPSYDPQVPPCPAQPSPSKWAAGFPFSVSPDAVHPPSPVLTLESPLVSRWLSLCNFMLAAGLASLSPRLGQVRMFVLFFRS